MRPWSLFIMSTRELEKNFAFLNMSDKMLEISVLCMAWKFSDQTKTVSFRDRIPTKKTATT